MDSQSPPLGLNAILAGGLPAATRESHESMKTAPKEVSGKTVKFESTPNDLQAPKESRSKRIKDKFKRNKPLSTSTKTDPTSDSMPSDQAKDVPESSGVEPTPTWNNYIYTKELEKAVEDLKKDYVSGARQMADLALNNLSSIIRSAARTAKDRKELWQMTVHAAKALSGARPSMSAAITSCLLHALDSISKIWDKKEKEEPHVTTEDLSFEAFSAMLSMWGKRRNVDIQMIGENFSTYLKGFGSEAQMRPSKKKFDILTLSNSSTIRTCILTALSSLPKISLTLYILESRPLFEGADMAARILSETSSESKSRLHVRIAPDSVVGTIARHVDLVLLGADRISSEGYVSNKIGSYAASLAGSCSKTTKVVVVSDIDKIVAPGAEENEKEIHPASEMMNAWKDDTRRELEKHVRTGNVEVFGEWFEWVPAGYVDTFITETGILSTSGVKKAAQKIGELEDKIFGDGKKRR